MLHEFRLSSRGSGRGISCDAEGAFIGAVPLLKRDGKERWQPRDCDQLSEQIGSHFGLPIDLSAKAGGLKAICNALNDGNLARAQIATVLLGIPDPPPLSKGVRSRSDTIKFIRALHWSGLIKWDPDEHPRWPAGSPDSQGGEFAPKGENPEPTAAAQSARIQLADAGISDASNDPVAEAAVRVAAQHDSGSPEAASRPTSPPVHPIVVKFVRQNSDAARRLANQIPGVTPEMVLAAVGRECKYGEDWKAKQYGNYGGVHFDDWYTDPDGKHIPVAIGQRGIRPFLPGQISTFWTAGVPSEGDPDVRVGQQEMASFPLNEGFELSGQIAIDKIKPYVPPAGIQSPEMFFELLHNHGYGIGNATYMQDTLERGPPKWGAYWLVLAASNAGG